MVYRFYFKIKRGDEVKNGFILAHDYIHAINFINEQWSAWDLMEISSWKDSFLHLAACTGSVYDE